MQMHLEAVRRLTLEAEAANVRLESAPRRPPAPRSAALRAVGISSFMRRLVVWQALAAKMTKKSGMDTEVTSGEDLIPAVHVAPPPTATLQARDLAGSCYPFLLPRQCVTSEHRSDAHTHSTGGSHADGGP